MTMIIEDKVLSLELSKKINEMWIDDVDSEYFWHRHSENDEWVCDWRDFCHKTVPITFKIYHAYRLDELPELFKAIGEKKGYDKPIWKCEKYNPNANEPGEGGCASLYCEYAGWKDMDAAFLRICELYAKTGELGEGSEVDTYLMDFLKHYEKNTRTKGLGSRKHIFRHSRSERAGDVEAGGPVAYVEAEHQGDA